MNVCTKHNPIDYFATLNTNCLNCTKLRICGNTVVTVRRFINGS